MRNSQKQPPCVKHICAAELVAPADPVKPGSTGVADLDNDSQSEDIPFWLEHSSDRFVLSGPIGEGSMGVVYRAFDQVLSKSVALKIFHADRQQNIDAIRREVGIAHKLQHPGFVRVHDVVSHAGTTCISMECLGGETLRTILANRGPMEPQEVIAIGIQLAEALAFAHNNYIAHCDLKPDNIILDKGRVRLIDFGLAISLISPGRRGEPRGTQLYMSPEQRQGVAVDHRTDIYSVGVILFEAAVGRQLTQEELASDGSETFYKDLQRLPSQLKRVIVRCVRLSPDKRFANARDLVAALTVDRMLPLRAQLSTAGLYRKHWRSLLIAALIILASVVLVATLYNANQPLISKPFVIVILPIQTPPQLEAEAAFVYESLWGRVGKTNQIHVWMLPPGIKASVSPQSYQDADVTVNITMIDKSQCQLVVKRHWAKLFRWTRSTHIISRNPVLLEQQVTNALSASGITLDVRPRASNGDLRLSPAQWASFVKVSHDIVWRNDNVRELEQDLDAMTGIIGNAKKCGTCYMRRAQLEIRFYELSREPQYLPKIRADVNEALLLHQSGNAWTEAAAIYMQLNDEAAATKALDNHEFKSRGTQQGLKLEGEALAQSGMYLNAVSALKEALERNPLDLRTANSLGLAEMAAGRYEDAIQSFEHILSLSPGNYAVLNNVALAYMRAGFMPQAIQALENVLNSSRTAESNSNLGMALVYSGKPCVVAIPYFARGAALAPKSEAVVGYLAHAYRWCGMRAEARETYRKAIGLAKEELRQSPSGNVYVNLAVYEAALGDSGQFELDLQSAREYSSSFDLDVEYEATIGFALLGDTERTSDNLVWLARSGYSMSFLRNNPDLMPYRAMLQRINLHQ